MADNSEFFSDKEGKIAPLQEFKETADSTMTLEDSSGSMEKMNKNKDEKREEDRVVSLPESMASSGLLVEMTREVVQDDQIDSASSDNETSEDDHHDDAQKANKETNNSEQTKVTMSSKIINLDSDDGTSEEEDSEVLTELNNKLIICINKMCAGTLNTPYYRAREEQIKFFQANRNKLGFICKLCSDMVPTRKMVEPSMVENTGNSTIEVLPISSDSESESEGNQAAAELVGRFGRKRRILQKTEKSFKRRHSA